MASFTDALEDNPAPRRLGDVWLSYEPGRLLGVSQTPSFWRRQLPTLLVALSVLLTGSVLVGLWVDASAGAALATFWVPGVLAAALGVLALRLEGRLGRRRFVLHFRSERLRLERLRWSPGATRAEWVPFDAVTSVDVVERADGRYALVVVWRPESDSESDSSSDKKQPEPEPRREVLVEHIPAGEQEALLRVWRMLHNAFGLRGAGLAGG